MTPVTDAYCPLCGHTGGRVHYRLAEDEGIRYAALGCEACGFVYLWPRPTPAYLEAYYAQASVYGLGSERPEDYRAIIDDKKALIGRFLKVSRTSPAGQAVDFGAGNGALVAALSELGFDATGVEISASARDAARRLFGVDMRDGDLSQFDEGSLSLITLFDVLEHMLHPVQMMRQINSRLKPGGLFIAGVPNYNALDRYTLGPGSKALIFPEHVNQFTASTLRACVGETLTVLYVGSPPPYGVAITLGMRRALIRHFGQNAFTRTVSKFLVALKKHVVYPLPNAFVEKTGLLGQSLLIVARKD